MRINRISEGRMRWVQENGLHLSTIKDIAILLLLRGPSMETDLLLLVFFSSYKTYTYLTLLTDIIRISMLFFIPSAARVAISGIIYMVVILRHWHLDH